MKKGVLAEDGLVEDEGGCAAANCSDLERMKVAGGDGCARVVAVLEQSKAVAEAEMSTVMLQIESS